MPHFAVRMLDEVLDGTVEPKIIGALTEAVVAVYGEWARPLVVVELSGLPRHRLGVGGQPATRNRPIIQLSMREAALTLASVDDPPARLVAAITEAMVTALGEDVRADVDVLLVGVPPGRSGVGGTLA